MCAGVYQWSIYHLSNRAFFSTVRNVDEATLNHNLSQVALYSLLQLASLAVITTALGWRLGLPALHQLAFVLTVQWRLVQCKMVLWFLVAVQTPLEHFGADFTFQFKWLKPPSRC